MRSTQTPSRKVRPIAPTQYTWGSAGFVAFLGLGVALFGLLALAMALIQYDISCQHLDPGNVQCSIQTSLNGQISLGPARVLEQVQSVEVESASPGGRSRNRSGSYRVLFHLSAGDEPLSQTFSGDDESKENLAAALNAFIQSEEAEVRFTADDSGGGRTTNIIVAVVVVCVGILFLLAALNQVLSLLNPE